MSFNIDKIVNVHKTPRNIRNICIIGHVDHGKTTVADSLIASNGIISQRMAGKMRYMDSREDEQVRGITMKSSAISLLHRECLVNLIDSPGHIDFSSEVSTAVRLCDGAVVLVDVVEGVSAQTHAVLRQAWSENIQPVLMLNKIDRLILELKFTPSEAYVHLHQIIQQVNVVMSELFTANVMSKTAQKTEPEEEIDDSVGFSDKVYDWMLDLNDTDDSNIYFSPERGNVVFSSALDSWAFSIGQFAHMLSAKMGMNADVLRKTLWGDFYLNSKTKRIMKDAQNKGKKALFVQLVLDNIWSVYEAVCINRDKEKVDKIVSSLQLKLSPSDTRLTEGRVYIKAIMSQWLPLHTTVLDMIVDQLPSPLDMTEERVENLLSNRSRPFSTLPIKTQQLKQAFLGCSSQPGAPVIAYVSKMFPVERSMLPENKQRPLTAEELKERHAKARQRLAERNRKLDPERPINESGAVTMVDYSDNIKNTRSTNVSVDKGDEHVFLAFARVFSGTLRKGQRLLVLGPKHDPSQITSEAEELLLNEQTVAELSPSCHVTACTVADLLVCMGREVESVTTVPAGNVIAIRGLEDHILKSATISTTTNCPPFTDMYQEAAAIVSVAIEPCYAGDMKQLMHGLKLLNQADPCVRVLVRETGEHVVVTAGEVHLDRCVRDLEQRYAKMKLNVSSPIVPFRETITDPPKLDMVNEVIDETNLKINTDDGSKSLEKYGLVEIYTADKKCLLHIRAVPLPDGITELIEENGDLIKKIESTVKSRRDLTIYGKGNTIMSGEIMSDIQSFKLKLAEIFNKSGRFWCNAVEKVWSFGPRHNGPNILLNNLGNYEKNVWKCWDNSVGDTRSAGVVHGFQLATLSGPICGEPMFGVCFVLEKWESCNNKEVLAVGEIGSKKPVSNVGSEGCGIVGERNPRVATHLCSSQPRPVTEPQACDDQNEARSPVGGVLNCDSEGKSVQSCTGYRDSDEVTTGRYNESITSKSNNRSSCDRLKDKSCDHVARPKCNGNGAVKCDTESNSGWMKQTAADDLVCESRDVCEPRDDDLNNSTVSLDCKKNTKCEGSKVKVSFVNSTNQIASLHNVESNDSINRCVNRMDKRAALGESDVKRPADSSDPASFQRRVRTRSYGHDDSDDPDSGDLGDEGQGSSENMAGQLMSCVKVGCQRAFQCEPQRLLAAMYECEIQATAEVLGRLYAVIGKRFGRILSEELREGTQMFTVVAVLPVVESFGFAEEIRTKTSGLASPQLKFSHWQIVDVDPYWVPSTEEEYMHYGEKADSENRARRYMNSVRRRKGLVVDEKLVEHAEKQRTLKKNK